MGLQDAVEALHTEREAKRHLAGKVSSLEQRVNANHTQREAELERLLDQVRPASACRLLVHQATLILAKLARLFCNENKLSDLLISSKFVKLAERRHSASLKEWSATKP